jgi:hypothetical protein
MDCLKNGSWKDSWKKFIRLEGWNNDIIYLIADVKGLAWNYKC